MKTQLAKIRLICLCFFSLTNKYIVKNAVGTIIAVARLTNLKHQKISFNNQEVTWIS